MLLQGRVFCGWAWEAAANGKDLLRRSCPSSHGRGLAADLRPNAARLSRLLQVGRNRATGLVLLSFETGCLLLMINLRIISSLAEARQPPRSRSAHAQGSRPRRLVASEQGHGSPTASRYRPSTLRLWPGLSSPTSPVQTCVSCDRMQLVYTQPPLPVRDMSCVYCRVRSPACLSCGSVGYASLGSAFSPSRLTTSSGTIKQRFFFRLLTPRLLGVLALSDVGRLHQGGAFDACCLRISTSIRCAAVRRPARGCCSCLRGLLLV